MNVNIIRCIEHPGDKASALHHMLCEMFAHQIKIKMFHFQTPSYAAHKATDKYLQKFAANFDRFMEVAQGIREFGGRDRKIATQRINLDVDMMKTTDELCQYLESFIKDVLDTVFLRSSVKQSGLMAIRDEMVADAQQLVYLLHFE